MYLTCPNCGEKWDSSGKYTSPQNNKLDAIWWRDEHLSAACLTPDAPTTKELIMPTSVTSATSAGFDLTGLAPLHPTLPHAVMYTLPDCPNCDRLKTWFKAAKLPVVAVSLELESDAYRLFSGELRVQQTPIVLVHNTFEDAAYFSGFDSTKIRLTVAAVKARLKALNASNLLSSLDSYITELTASVEPEQKYPFLRAEVFAALAARHVRDDSAQPARCTTPEELSPSTPVIAA